MSAWPALKLASTPGKALLAYQHEDVSGPVVSKRDTGGTDLGLEGGAWVDVEKDILDARRTQMSLEKNGFSFVAGDELSQKGIDFMNNEDIVNIYYPSCERLLWEELKKHGVVGSDSGIDNGDVLIRAFDHNIRSQRMYDAQRQIQGGNLVQTPVSFVHGDYTKVSLYEISLLICTPNSYYLLPSHLHNLHWLYHLY